MCESEMRAAMSWNWRGKPRRIATNHIAIAVAIASATTGHIAVTATAFSISTSTPIPFTPTFYFTIPSAIAVRKLADATPW